MTAADAATEFDFQGQRCVQIDLPQGDRAVISLYGAQVLSWQTPDGHERFYLSPRAIMDGSSAIRGGVPVCFPQFNQRILAGLDSRVGLDLPKHGFVRNQIWSVGSVQQSSLQAQARFELADNESTRAIWPHRFNAALTVHLTPGCLRITIEVANPGPVPWPFAVALHSYFAVADIALTTVSGLAGHNFWDGVKNPERPALRDVQPAGLLTFDGETDRVYENVNEPLELVSGTARLRITQSATLPEAVVWNPGARLCATLKDLPSNGWKSMVCVEAACINTPQLLMTGETWTGWQQLEVA